MRRDRRDASVNLNATVTHTSGPASIRLSKFTVKQGLTTIGVATLFDEWQCAASVNIFAAEGSRAYTIQAS